MSAPLSDVQTALRDAILGTIGPEFGIGGASWLVTRPGTGNGVTAAAGAMTSAGTLAGYVRRVRRVDLERALPGVEVPNNPWIFAGALDQVLSDAQPLAVGCVLTSVADSTLAFRIAGLPPWPGYVFGLLEQER
jgi:hypothetical protein